MRRHTSASLLLLFLIMIGAIGVDAGCAAVLGIEDTIVDLRENDASSLEDAPPIDGGGNGTGDADTGTLPAVDGGPCALEEPFGAVTPLAARFNTPAISETGARYSADELTIYLGRGRDAYFATRPDTQTAFAAPTAITELNVPAPGVSGYVAPFPNGVRAIYGSLRAGDTTTDIYEVTRASATAVWNTPPSKVIAASSGSQDEHPWLRHDGRALYFDSNRPTGGGGGGSMTYDIYRADVEISGKVVAPAVRVGGISTTAADEVNPVVTADELTMYFSRSPGLNIHKATRAKISDLWSDATPVTELNSANGERLTWISGDGCRILLSSDRSGAGDLYMAEKPKPK